MNPSLLLAALLLVLAAPLVLGLAWAWRDYARLSAEDRAASRRETANDPW